VDGSQAVWRSDHRDQAPIRLVETGFLKVERRCRSARLQESVKLPWQFVLGWSDINQYSHGAGETDCSSKLRRSKRRTWQSPQEPQKKRDFGVADVSVYGCMYIRTYTTCAYMWAHGSVLPSTPGSVEVVQVGTRLEHSHGT
jgi:hypothetical protein